MSQLENNTVAWLEFMNLDHSNTLGSEATFLKKSSAFGSLLNDSNASELAIFNPCFTEEYLNGVKELSTNNHAPISVYDGLQTTINMCRAKSGYNPLDQSEGGKGSGKYFIAFTDLVAKVPFLTLDWAEPTRIVQESRNANVLIDSFLKGFKGIRESDQTKIRDAIVELVKAALSYSKTVQKKSIFTQNIFSVENKNKDLEKVICTLYSSTFEISQTKNKGVITFHSEYSVLQASYSLSTSNWERIKSKFADKENESVDDWIKDMTTPVDKSSEVKALCLES